MKVPKDLKIYMYIFKYVYIIYTVKRNLKSKKSRGNEIMETETINKE